MKKFLTAAAIVLAVLTVYFCFFDGEDKKDSNKDDNKGSVSQNVEQTVSYGPVYDSLNSAEKRAYREIRTAINDFKKSTSQIYKSNSLDEAKKFGSRMQSLYRDIAYEQSENFWVDPYNSEMVIQEYKGEYTVFIEPAYLLDKDAARSMQDRFDEKIEEIVKNAEAKPTTFEKILYVYDYILENCAYDHALVEREDYNQPAINAYGCLVEGKTICSGYTLAFDAIMKRLGFECGVEFNNYSGFSILSGHVWNYCKIDGEYYYFDLTWDDTVFDSDEYKKYLDHPHMYFAITKDELSKTNYSLSPDAPTPLCNGTAYNYFSYNGYNISEYSLDAVKDVIGKQSEHKYIALRFDSYSELLKADSELLGEKKIFDLMPGKGQIRYIISDANLHLYIFFADETAA